MAEADFHQLLQLVGVKAPDFQKLEVGDILHQVGTEFVDAIERDQPMRFDLPGHPPNLADKIMKHIHELVSVPAAVLGVEADIRVVAVGVDLEAVEGKLVGGIVVQRPTELSLDMGMPRGVFGDVHQPEPFWFFLPVGFRFRHNFSVENLWLPFLVGHGMGVLTVDAFRGGIGRHIREGENPTLPGCPNLLAGDLRGNRDAEGLEFVILFSGGVIAVGREVVVKLNGINFQAREEIRFLGVVMIRWAVVGKKTVPQVVHDLGHGGENGFAHTLGLIGRAPAHPGAERALLSAGREWHGNRFSIPIHGLGVNLDSRDGILQTDLQGSGFSGQARGGRDPQGVSLAGGNPNLFRLDGKRWGGTGPSRRVTARRGRPFPCLAGGGGGPKDRMAFLVLFRDVRVR